MKTNTITILAFGVIILYNLVQLRETKNLKSELTHLKESKLLGDSISFWRAEQLKIYVPISLKQSEIIDTFHSSRNAAKRSKELSELQFKLN